MFNLQKRGNKGYTGYTRRLLLLICLCIFSSCIFHGANASADTGFLFSSEDASYKIISGRSAIPVIYSPEMFLATSNTGEINPDLAKLSMLLADDAYEKNYIGKLLEDMGFSASDCDSYASLGMLSLTFNDIAAYYIAHREYKGFNIYVVPIKGTSSNEEWFSNFHLHDSYSGDYHAGFYKPAMEIYTILKSRLEKSQNNIVLLTGHSRGAAISNLVGGMLLQNNIIAKECMFCYNFACPAVGKGVSHQFENANIFNFNNSGDLITLLPRETWGYGRYGRDIKFGPYSGEIDGESYEAVLDEIAPTESSFEEYHFVFDLVAWALIYGKMEKWSFYKPN